MKGKPTYTHFFDGGFVIEESFPTKTSQKATSMKVVQQYPNRPDPHRSYRYPSNDPAARDRAFERAKTYIHNSIHYTCCDQELQTKVPNLKPKQV